MIHINNEHDLDQSLEFVLSVQTKRDTQSYPTVEDSDLISYYLDRTLVVTERNDDFSINALGSFIVDEDKKIIQTVLGIYQKNTDKNYILSIIKFLRDTYKGYALLVSYPIDNEYAIDCMSECGAICIDEGTVTIFEKNRLPKLKYSHLQIESISSKNKSEFKTYYDTLNPNVYWNSDRIFRKRRPWSIFIERENRKIIGSVLYRKIARSHVEIISFQSSHDAAYEFLNRTLRYCVEEGIETVDFLVNTNDSVSLAAALANGFRAKISYETYQLDI